MHTVQVCHPMLAKTYQIPFHCKQNTICSLWETITICRMSPTNAAPLVLGQLKSWSAFTGNSSFGRFSADVGTAMIFVHAAHAFCKTGKVHQHPQHLCVQATKSVQYTHRLQPATLGRLHRVGTRSFSSQRGKAASPVLQSQWPQGFFFCDLFCAHVL